MPCQKRTFGHSRCTRSLSTSDATIRAEGKGAAGIGTRIWRGDKAPAARGDIDLAGKVLLFATVSCNKPPLRQHSAVSAGQAGQAGQSAIRRHETPLSPGFLLPHSNLCELGHFGEFISFSHNE
jgi:hypothetical protein